MKCKVIWLLLIFAYTGVRAQEGEIGKARLVLGLAGPELLHAGFNYRLTNANMLGLSAGIGPSWGTVWPALSVEHRLYLGANSAKTEQKTWFFRQGSTFFPKERAPQRFTLNLTVGKDIPFKNLKNGFTLDAGVFYLAESQESSIILVRSLNLWPAFRFQFYFGL